MADTQPLRGTTPPSVNVAEAYPRTKPRPIPLLLLVTVFGSILAYLVHRNTVTLPLKSKASPTAPRIAVCYSGNVATHAHVYEQNLKVIRALDPNAAFFYYIDLVDDYAHERTGETYHMKHEIGGLQPVFDQVQAAAVTTYTAADVETPQQGHCYKRAGESANHYTNHFVQFYAANKCYEMVRRAEESGQKFEWILRLQPNMHIAVKLPPKDVEPRVHMSGAAIALVPRQMADAFFTVEQAFTGDNCRVLDHMGQQPCTNYSYDSDSVECLIIKWLKESNIVPSNGVYVNRRIIYPTDGQSR